MDEKAQSLFRERNLVFVATIMPDGSPQLSPVWANFENGHVLVNTAEGRQKHRNVLRDPRVAVSVVSEKDPLHMTSIRGTVVDLIPDYEYEHADRLAKQYMGRDQYPYRQDKEKRVTLKIRPDRVFVMPELRMNPE